MSALAIEATGLSKRYGDRTVLHGVDFRVERGALVGLIGPNGAGKSTMLRAFVGMIRRDGGDVRVLDLDPATDGLEVRRLVAYLPGETSVYHQMTGQQFLDFALSFHARRQERLARDLVDLFQLPLQRRVRSYSAGMKQKLAILATLVPDVQLYLLDEPDRALDASVRFELRAVLQQLVRDGRTILLSSHHLSEVETLAHRLEFLLAGRLVDATRIEAVRGRLRRRVRLRLTAGQTLPPGSRLLGTEPDDTIVLETDGPPLEFLRLLPPAAVLAAEIGMVRLEELYQLLLDANGAAAGARS